MERTTDLRGVQGGKDWIEGRRSAKEHRCMTHTHRQQCDGSQRDRESGPGAGEQRRGRSWGTSVIVSIILKKPNINWKRSRH